TESKGRSTEQNYTPRSRDVAAQKAIERWDRDLREACRGDPTLYGRCIEAIRPDDTAEATAAEINREGDGLRLLQERLGPLQDRWGPLKTARHPCPNARQTDDRMGNVVR